MGVRIIADEDGACLYCSTSGVAFGPVFSDREAAEHFLHWFNEKIADSDNQDPRCLNAAQLDKVHEQWDKEYKEEKSKVKFSVVLVNNDIYKFHVFIADHLMMTRTLVGSDGEIVSAYLDRIKKLEELAGKELDSKSKSKAVIDDGLPF